MSIWLVKFASRQTPVADQFRQQINALPVGELQSIAGAPFTSNLESFQEKAASAIQQGRALAHEAGDQIMGKMAASAAIDRSMVEAINSLSDEDAIKLAEMLESGSDVEKVAGVMGMAGQALKGIGGFAMKHPHAAAAAGGAVAGGLSTGSMKGALGGAAVGAGMSAIPGVNTNIARGGRNLMEHGAGMMPKLALDAISNLYKTAMMCGDSISGGSGESGWLGQFEGTPLLEQAIELVEHDLQLEIQEIQKRQEQQAQMQESNTWIQRDVIRAKKHLLELQLVAQRNGLGQAAQQAPEQAQQQQAQQPAVPPQAEQPQAQKGVGLPGGVQAPLGGGQEKQASLPFVVRR